jgi:hypothetical protein
MQEDPANPSAPNALENFSTVPLLSTAIPISVRSDVAALELFQLGMHFNIGSGNCLHV